MANKSEDRSARAEEAPGRLPMRANGEQIRRNPSTDQKKARNRLRKSAGQQPAYDVWVHIGREHRPEIIIRDVIAALQIEADVSAPGVAEFYNKASMAEDYETLIDICKEWVNIQTADDDDDYEDDDGAVDFRWANPFDREGSKIAKGSPMFPWNLITASPGSPATSVPTHQIEWLVNRMHVSTTDADVEADIRGRAKNWKPEQTQQAVDHAIKHHRKNQDQYRSVMGSRTTANVHDDSRPLCPECGGQPLSYLTNHGWECPECGGVGRSFDRGDGKFDPETGLNSRSAMRTTADASWIDPPQRGDEGEAPGTCRCGSTNVTLSGNYGPGGRLGDPGGVDRAECQDCGMIRWWNSKPLSDPFTDMMNGRKGSRRTAGSHDPIAYTYEADHHCPDCAKKRFGVGANGFIAEDAEDSEGNPVGVIAPWDEWSDSGHGDCESLNCGDCGEEIDTAHKPDCEENYGQNPCMMTQGSRHTAESDGKKLHRLMDPGETEITYGKCSRCNGTGSVVRDSWNDEEEFAQKGQRIECPSCWGDGLVGRKKSSQHREAQLLSAMAQSPDLVTMRALDSELQAIRSARRDAALGAREAVIGASVNDNILTPVRVYERHTAATDWITEIPSIAIEGSMEHSAVAEASVWYARRSPEVKADRDELREQALGAARRYASQFGASSNAVEHAYLTEVNRLHVQAVRKTAGPYDQHKWQYVHSDGTGAGWFTDDDRKKMDQNPDDDGHTWREITSDERSSMNNWYTEQARIQSSRKTADVQPFNVKEEGHRGYIGLHKGKQYACYAKNTLHAQELIAAHCKAKKSYDVDVYLAEHEDGGQATHTITSAKSRNCSNGNHGDCGAQGKNVDGKWKRASCSCSCHNQGRGKSGACSEKDHKACQMGTDCSCSCHHKTASGACDYCGGNAVIGGVECPKCWGTGHGANNDDNYIQGYEPAPRERDQEEEGDDVGDWRSVQGSHHHGVMQTTAGSLLAGRAKSFMEHIAAPMAMSGDDAFAFEGSAVVAERGGFKDEVRDAELWGGDTDTPTQCDFCQQKGGKTNDASWEVHQQTLPSAGRPETKRKVLCDGCKSEVEGGQYPGTLTFKHLGSLRRTASINCPDCGDDIPWDDIPEDMDWMGGKIGEKGGYDIKCPARGYARPLKKHKFEKVTSRRVTANGFTCPKCGKEFWEDSDEAAWTAHKAKCKGKGHISDGKFHKGSTEDQSQSGQGVSSLPDGVDPNAVPPMWPWELGNAHEHAPNPLEQGVEELALGPNPNEVPTFSNLSNRRQAGGWQEATCQHCDRRIIKQPDGIWIDPEAKGDDHVWREVCDTHDSFQAEHEPHTGSRRQAAKCLTCHGHGVDPGDFTKNCHKCGGSGDDNKLEGFSSSLRGRRRRLTANGHSITDTDGEAYWDHDSRCPACGDAIDYCQGHGEMGDPEGNRILEAHDNDDHSDCHPDGCDQASMSWGEVADQQSRMEGARRQAATYKIVRHKFDGPKRTMKRGLTLEEAQAHCQRDDTKGDGWFDGYYKEGSRRSAATSPEEIQSGQGASSLPDGVAPAQVGPAFPWDLAAPGSDAANVADVPTPGAATGGYPQPTARRRQAGAWGQPNPDFNGDDLSDLITPDPDGFGYCAECQGWDKITGYGKCAECNARIEADSPGDRRSQPRHRDETFDLHQGSRRQAAGESDGQCASWACKSNYKGKPNWTVSVDNGRSYDICDKCVADHKMDKISPKASRRVQAVSMQRAHYEHIADSIASAPVDKETAGRFANHMADHVGPMNQHFKRDEFVNFATSGTYSNGSGSKSGVPKYSRGHYEAIADGIKSFDGDPDTKAKLADHFTSRMSGTNPAFKGDKFRQRATGSRRLAAYEIKPCSKCGKDSGGSASGMCTRCEAASGAMGTNIGSAGDKCKDCGVDLENKECMTTAHDGLYSGERKAQCRHCHTDESRKSASRRTADASKSGWCPFCESNEHGTPDGDGGYECNVCGTGPMYIDEDCREFLASRQASRRPLVRQAGANSEFVDAYIECALWSSHDESDESGGEPFDANYGPEDIAPKAITSINQDCSDFVEQAGELLDGIDMGQAGHDFWLTRNGHGAGFWDRGLGDVGDKLTQLCKQFGEVWPVLGDDGSIYFE